LWPFSAILASVGKKETLMNREERIKKNSHFRFIYGRGKSHSNEYLVLYIFKNNKNINRVGISVSKKVGKSVVRSRVKRLIKESYRVNKPLFKKGYDNIFVARVKSSKANYHEIEKSIILLMKKGGLLLEEGNK
jgi:ribonuclease P protein component